MLTDRLRTLKIAGQGNLAFLHVIDEKLDVRTIAGVRTNQAWRQAPYRKFRTENTEGDAPEIVRSRAVAENIISIELALADIDAKADLKAGVPDLADRSRGFQAVIFQVFGSRQDAVGA